MEESIPEDVIPLTNYQLSLNFGRLYKDVGRPEELERRLENILEVENLQPYDKMFLAQTYYHELDNIAKSESLTQVVINENPEFFQAYFWLANMYSENKQYDKGIKILEDFLAIRKNEPRAMQLIAEMRTLKNLDSTRTQAPASNSE